MEERFGALLLFGGLAGFLGEVTLAGDGRVLQRVGPRAQLPGNGFGEGFEVGDFRFEMSEVIHALQETQHRADFASRTTRDIEERQQLLRRAALEAFGDVVGNRQRGSLKLATEVALIIERSIGRQFEDALGDRDAGLPDRQLFKPLVLHGDLKSQISNLKSTV